MQVVWFGARYAITNTLDVAAAYYHYDQNNFGGVASCATNSGSNSSCAGTMNAASAMIDWRFAPKWDAYLGTFFSEFNGGLGNGYLAHNNLATTAGVRFKF
jgi:hypothetical protein